MSYVHPEEEAQVWALLGYERDHPGTGYLVAFADGECYVCLLDTSYDSDNCGEFDIEMDHPGYDEFHRVEMEILATVQGGLRPYRQWLGLDYRDWPAVIWDADTDAVVYPAVVA